MEFKKCNSCLEIKNIICFYNNNYCKDCYIKKVKNNYICDYCKLEKNDFYFTSKFKKKCIECHRNIMKEYYKNKKHIKVKCECGKEVDEKWLEKHHKTNFHSRELNRLANINF